MSKQSIFEINTKLAKARSDKSEHERTLPIIKGKYIVSTKNLNEVEVKQSAAKKDLLAYEKDIQNLQTNLKTLNEARATGDSALKITSQNLLQIQQYHTDFIHDKTTINRKLENNNSILNTLRSYSNQIPQDKSTTVSNIAIVDNNIYSLQGNNANLIHGKTICTDHIKKMEENLVILNNLYDQEASFRQNLKREDFYDEYTVTVKHTTYFLPHIKGHPRYSEHMEREFNQKAYDESIQNSANNIAKVNNALNELKNKIQNMHQKLTQIDQNIVLNNQDISEQNNLKQILTHQLNESVEVGTVCQQKIQECIQANQDHANNLLEIEECILEAKETVDILMGLKQTEEETLRGQEKNALNLQQQLDSLFEKKAKVAQKLMNLEEEGAIYTKSALENLEQEGELKFKLATTDKTIKVLESQLCELRGGGIDELSSLTTALQIDERGEGALGLNEFDSSNHHADTALAGHNPAFNL